MFQILVAEDDKSLRRLIETFLVKNGYTVHCACDGKEALDILDKEHIDLIVSDIMMPNMDGYMLTDQLRKAEFTQPILFITAKETIEAKRKGFLVGVDDYMVKPIDLEEMCLRIQALLRRSKIVSERKLTIGEVELCYDELCVKKGDLEISLPKKEFYLLYKLLSYPNKIFTRSQLMDEIWGMESETDDATVAVHIQRLREKFSDFEEFKIVTVRGLGYKAVKNI